MQLHSLFAQQNVGNTGGGFVAFLVFLIQLAIVVVVIASMWTCFTKAGRPGWASIVPIYNIMVYLDIAGKPMWWILLYLIPLVNIVIAIIATLSFASAYGKSAAFAVGLIFLPFIFYPLLAFGDSRYRGAPPSNF